MENNNLIIYEVVNFYSELNSTDFNLQSLDVIDNLFNSYYWYICLNTKTLYYMNIIINDQINVINNLQEILTYLKMDKYIRLDFKITDNQNHPSISNNLYDFTIDSKKYFILDMDITEIKTKESKKRKINHCESDEIDWSKMIGASSTRNYMLNDPLIDWLKEFNINSINDKPSKIMHRNKRARSNSDNMDIFTKHIFGAGDDFENELMNIISKFHKVVKVCDINECKLVEKFNDTINLIKKGTPIIYQGVLHNYDNNTFGMPDLIVRSDYINRLMGYNVILNEEEKINSPKLNLSYHYKIIDIKHSNIPLRADGIHILNSFSIPAYKAQILIYTMALNNILGIDIKKSFIWGKRYTWKTNGMTYEDSKFLNKLGIIDYDNIDCAYINQTNDAIKWIKTMKEEGINWNLLPLPSCKELYPNMKNDKDSQYRKLKNDLSKEIYEITNIWNCGIKRRETAHKHNIYSWNNPNCTAKNMGFVPGKIASTVDKILQINRQTKDLIKPDIISYDVSNWKDIDDNTMEFYLDFETLNSNIDCLIKDGVIYDKTNPYIFMIGVGYYSEFKWIFKTFLLKAKNLNAELEMFNDFVEYINNILVSKDKQKCKMYHWSHAEVSAYSSLKYRHSNKINFTNMTFYDLSKVFINEPITVYGALDFSLKSIAKALNNNNLINSSWDTTSACSNGLNAMILANNIYNENNEIDKSNLTMKEIIYYNEIDCKVMWEIHYLIKQKT